jgi:hypothetical protein
MAQVGHPSRGAFVRGFQMGRGMEPRFTGLHTVAAIFYSVARVVECSRLLQALLISEQAFQAFHIPFKF